MAVIFVTVLVDMLSFGILIPDLQLRANSFGASGLELGLLIAGFSIAQFVVSPFAGRLSDRYGRKPILMAGALLNCSSYLVYAFAHTVPAIVAARVLGGIGASNLAAAYAYVADVSAPEARAKSMGFLGAAFGLGFVMGPPMGGLLAHAGGNRLLGIVSASIVLGNFIWIAISMGDTREHSRATIFSPRDLLKAMAVPALAILLLMFFAYNFGFSNMESTFVLFANKKFGLNQEGSGLFLGYVGILIAIVQGLLVGPLTKRFGEKNLARFGLLLVAPALAMIPYMQSVPLLMVNAVFLCLGSGLATPSIASLISKSASTSIQGGVFGVTHGLSALARIFGPVVGQTALARSLSLPYLIAGGLVMISVAVAWLFVGRFSPAGST